MEFQNFSEVKYLIDRIENSNLVEFELKLDNDFIKMSKTSTKIKQEVLTEQVFETKNSENEVLKESKEEIVIENANLVKSPIVGTFYEKPSPDKPVFVKTGDFVKKGDTLCIVEAMKVMNEICSDFDGKVLEICSKNGEMVEYGAVLFKIG